MKFILVIAAVAGLGLATPALAAHRCTAPVGQWQPREALQKKLAAAGWTVRGITTEHGCYEAKAVNARGQRLEKVYDPKTLAPVGGTGRDADD